MKTDQAVVWGHHAQQWSRVGPPLKPSPQDGELTLQALASCLNDRAVARRVAVLGVTPEIVSLAWPEHVHLLAFDHSARMIADVWEPSAVVPSTVYEADWRELPLEAGSIHAVVGDGALNVLPGFDAYGDVLRELHRVMASDARLVLRCFICPDQPETLLQIKEAVKARTVGSFHALKWRLAMSLASVTNGCVPVADIHAAFEELFPDRLDLSRMTGWEPGQIDTIDAYQSASTRYNFPTLQGMRACCSPWFEVQTIQYAAYELAERCPTLSFRRLQVSGVQSDESN